VRTVRTEKHSCPTCDAKLDARSDPTGENIPVPGDFTICIYCRDIFKFSETLGLLSLEEADIAELPLDVVSRYQAVIREVMEKNHRKENDNEQ